MRGAGAGAAASPSDGDEERAQLLVQTKAPAGSAGAGGVAASTHAVAGSDIQDAGAAASAPIGSSSPQQSAVHGRAQCWWITVLWFTAVLSQSIPTVALRQFILIELQASPATQAILFGVVYAIPWNLKFVAAFISDTLPIRGRRRRPYMVAGVLGEGLFWGLLSWLPASTLLTAGLMFMQRISLLFKAVMLDTITVETMNRYEAGDQKGKLQSSTRLWGKLPVA